LGGGAVRDHAAQIEGGDAIADPEHEVGVMLHQQHTDPAVADDADDFAKPLDFRDGETARRLVANRPVPKLKTFKEEYMTL
jgi:hypothetical protein